MPVQSITELYDTADPPNLTGYRITGAGPTGVVDIIIADLPAGKPAKLVYIQELFDVRLLLSSLPSDHPDVVTDPARPDYFHAEIDGEWYLVSRPINVYDYVEGGPGLKRVPQVAS